MTKLSLHFCDCSIGRNSRCMVNNLSCELRSGTVVVLLGSNGAGKSTLFYTLLREIPLLAGKIFVQGKDIEEFSGDELASLCSFLLTTREFDSFLTVRECLELGRYPFRKRDKYTIKDDIVIERYIEQFALQPFLQRRLACLSDGERQRVLIARTFIQDTPFIFLDEPSNFLDVRYRLELFLFIKELAEKENKIIIFSSHDIEVAAKLFSNFWLIDQEQRTMLIGTKEIFAGKSFNKTFTTDRISFSMEHKTFKFR